MTASYWSTQLSLLVLSAAMLPTMLFVVIGVVSKVLSAALPVLKPIVAAVVESSKTILLESTTLELVVFVLILIVALDAVVPFVFVASFVLVCEASAVVGATYSIKVVSDRILLVFNGVEPIIVLVIGAVLARLAGAELVLAKASLMVLMCSYLPALCS